MRITKRNRATVLAVATVSMMATVMMSLPVTPAHSEPRGTRGAPAAESTRDAVGSQADTAAPLSVNPALDSARAVTSLIPIDGGTLSVTAATGALFTLTIPKDAFLEAETITMTPAASIADLPLGGGLAGGGAVQIEPAGLLLSHTATLSIAPAAPLSIDQQSPFAWSNAGEDFRLFPLRLDLTATTMDLDHLGGFGIGSGGASDRQNIAAHQPGRLQAQREQKIELAVEDARNALSGNPTRKQQKKAKKKLAATLTDLFEADLALIEAELTSTGGTQTVHEQATSSRSPLCALIDLLIVLGDGAAATDAGLIPAPPGPGDYANARSVIQALKNKYYHDCGQDIRQFAYLLALANLVEELASKAPASADLDGLVPDILNYAYLCAGGLTLVFDSKIDATYPYGNESITVHSDVPLIFNKSRRVFDGDAPLTHPLGFIFRASGGCSIVTGYVDDVCHVTIEIGDLSLTDDCSTDSALPDYSVVIDVGDPTESFLVTCSGAQPITANTGIWAGQYECSHTKEKIDHNVYRVRGLKPGTGDVFAEADYKGVLCDVNPFTENTSIKLVKAH